MSHAFAISDEDYAAIEEVARRSGRDAEELFHE
jgi:predicted transcriptional regulator